MQHKRCECSSKDDSQVQATTGTKRLYVKLRSAPELICCNRYHKRLQIHDNQTKKLTKKTG